MYRPYVSREIDRRAWQAQRNIMNLSRYRKERERLDRLKMQLAQIVMVRYPHAGIKRIEEAIRSGHHKLETGANLTEAIANSCGLLEEEKA